MIRVGRFVPALALLACVAVWGVSGAEVAAEKKAPEDPFIKELNLTRSMIANAVTKLNRGIVGTEFEGAKSTAPQTPGRRCCSGNLQYIDESMARLRGLVREVSTCFEQRRDLQSVEAVNIVIQDMRGLTTTLDIFRDSDQQSTAQAAIAAAQRSWIRLHDSLKAMPRCEIGAKD